MNTMTLTDRYVSAVTRNLPERQRDDVARELRASIADQLDARAEAGESVATAERDTIVALGDPEILAAEYAERPLRLIGPRYFLAWKRLLILLLWIVPAAAAAGVLIGKLLDGSPAGEVIGTVAFVTMTTAIHVCFWVTLVFAVLERTTAKTAAGPLIPWTVDSLPEPKQNGATLPDLVATIVLLLIFAAVILWDLSFGFVPGHRVSLIAAALWPVTILILFALMLATMIVAGLVHRGGRWTYPLATVNALVGVGVVVALLSVPGGFTDGLLNREFFDTVIPGSSAAEVHHVLGVVTWVFVGAIVLWSAVDGFLKARRAHRSAAPGL